MTPSEFQLLPKLQNLPKKPYHGSNVPSTWHMQHNSPSLRFKSIDLSNKINDIETSTTKFQDQVNEYLKTIDNSC